MTAIGTLIPTLRESLEENLVAFRDKLKAMVTRLASQIRSPNLSDTGIVAEGDPKHVVVKMAEDGEQIRSLWVRQDSAAGWQDS